MSSFLHSLFVAWESPVSRRHEAVARLSLLEGDDCEACFEFVYIRGAREARGFRPFPSFPQFEEIYRSEKLFPMFANRLIPSNRPDFPEFISQMGLVPAMASPMRILGRSAGRRATDTLELFPLPKFDPHAGYQTWFWARGVRALTPAGRLRIDRLVSGEQLSVQIDDAVDGLPRIWLIAEDRVPVGTMPEYLLDDTCTLQEQCGLCDVFVEHVNPSPAPLQQRLLLRLESCWPDGFVPYTSARYQPIPPGAATLQLPFVNPFKE